MASSAYLLGLLAAATLVVRISAEDLAKPDIPDPFGLGERLALIDHLRETMGVTPPSDASYEALVALYWQHRSKPAEPTAEEALARDRLVRLRAEIVRDFAIEPPADAGEDALTAILAEAREKRIQAATEHAAEAAGNDITRSDIGNLQAQIERIAGDIRGEREATAAIVEELSELADAYREASAKLEQLAAARVATAVYNAQLLVLNNIENKGRAQAARHEQIQRRIVQLNEQRLELDGRLSAMRSESTADDGKPRREAAPEGSFEAKLKAAVVLINVQGRGTGTGFFISGDGYLVTNAHVVGNEGQQATAQWDDSAGHKPMKLRLVKVDESTDLALLRADSDETMKFLELREIYGLSKAVVAVGFPLAGSVALTLGTSPSDIVVSRGILGSVRHKDNIPEWLQHDCKIASGNSGGPLIDLETATVIGINSMVMDPGDRGGGGDSLSFAIPVKKAIELFAPFRDEKE
jgi:S1-C subfamily serine protease